MLTIRFLGTGTPIGARGLLQSCMLLETSSARVLLDCGMTSMVALHRAGVEPASVDGVIVSHLHGDHFGGLPVLLLDGCLQARTRPLRIAGPPSTAERVRQALEVFGWAGAWERAQSFLEFVTLSPGEPAQMAELRVIAFSVPHNPATEPMALRIEQAGVTLAYSGDAGWSTRLVEAAEASDAFVCAVWAVEDDDPAFLDYRTLRQHASEFNTRRTILTHLGPPMLDYVARAVADGFEVASDGLVVELA